MEVRLDEWRELAMREDAAKRKAAEIQEFINTVPKRFRNKDFIDFEVETLEQRRVKAVAERFIATAVDRIEEGSVLRFLGHSGTGKTFLSLIMSQAIVHQGFTAHYEPSLQFLRVLLEKRYDSVSVYQSLIDYYSRIQFLVLDEVTEAITKDGVPSEVERKVLQDVINVRYQQKSGATLIISNRNLSELTSRLGKPIADRLSENSITLVFNWNSYRQK